MRFVGQNKKALLAMAIGLYLTSPVSAVQASDEIVQSRDVIVSATRTQQEIKETPASVEVITREDIENLGADSVVSALKLAANVDITKAGMTGNKVSIRGMNTSQTLILIDGRRMAGEDTSVTANFYELDRINLTNVERIEIVRGPVSSLYGSDALGGVINIITRKSDVTTSQLGLSTGSEQRNVDYHLDLGKNGKWAWSFDTRYSDILKQTYATENTNMFGDRHFFNISGTYDLTEDKKIDVFYEYMKENLAEDYASGNKEYWENQRRSYGITYRGKKAAGDYELRMYFNKLEKDDNTYTSARKLSDFDVAKYETFVVDGKNTTQIGDNHLLTYGGEYRQTSYRGTRLGNGGDDIFSIERDGVTKTGSKATIDYYAAYVQDEWVINDRLLVIPSLRYDDSDKFGDKVSPKIGMTYKMNDNYRLKASYGTGFKAPSISELYMNMTRQMGTMKVTVAGNPDLQPEESKNFELSLEGERGNSFGKLTYFHNDVDNLIGTETKMSYIPGSGMVATSKYVNVNKAKIDGVELELGRHLNDKWTVKLTSNYLDAIDKKDDARLEDRAKNRTTLQLQYDDVDNSGIHAVIWNEWINKYRYSKSDYDYSTFNVSVSKKFNDTVNGYVAVENIFDKKIDDLAIDGRVWRCGVQMQL
ncbi:TonB-dependent receptor plug domain-containing protein [Anaerosinus sp.]